LGDGQDDDIPPTTTPRVAAAEDARDQIVRLREQVEMLMSDRVTPAVAEFAGRAESALHAAAEQAREASRSATDELIHLIRERPLTSIFLAGGIGYLLRSLLRR
jgi:ElaB/YqjD/DUF883 family membrane-anchored ribosome-binding protein